MDAKKQDNIIVILFVLSVVPAIFLTFILELFFIIGLPFILYGSYCMIVKRAWLISKIPRKSGSNYATGKDGFYIGLMYVLLGIVFMVFFYFLVTQYIYTRKLLEDTAMFTR